MRSTILLVASLLAASSNAADFHHVHVRAEDTVRAAHWYAENMSGEQLQVANFHGVRFARTLLLFAPKNRPGADGSAAPSTLKTSDGTALDHLGFSFADLEAQLISLQLSGAKIVQPAHTLGGQFTHAFIEDPWGQKVEILQDTELTGFHHAHVVSQEPGKTIKWYQEQFGGEATNFKSVPSLPAIRFGDFWLISSRSEFKPSPNMFTMLDHLGFHVTDVEEQMSNMQEANTPGIRILKPAQGFYWWQEIPFIPGPKNGFVESPDGVTIEIMQTN